MSSRQYFSPEVIKIWIYVSCLLYETWLVFWLLQVAFDQLRRPLACFDLDHGRRLDGDPQEDGFVLLIGGKSPFDDLVFVVPGNEVCQCKSGELDQILRCIWPSSRYKCANQLRDQIWSSGVYITSPRKWEQQHKLKQSASQSLSFVWMWGEEENQTGDSSFFHSHTQTWIVIGCKYVWNSSGFTWEMWSAKYECVLDMNIYRTKQFGNRKQEVVLFYRRTALFKLYLLIRVSLVRLDRAVRVVREV